MLGEYDVYKVDNDEGGEVGVDSGELVVELEESTPYGMEHKAVYGVQSAEIDLRQWTPTRFQTESNSSNLFVKLESRC